ncbi:nucleoside deaminase [Streptomyces sp. KN37]|uniref:nucleoside deaminase n=1 Tax=Streptomyces sp. KN37 TaxID=3090667 RepID=UPI002A75F1EA|nr:nucleoside deaminase [Streptomyces sp. KN37]WPO76760.1 nucleoside deaminase [Streptomyces sp. KN37]
MPGDETATLPAIWQLPFELAWEAFRAGSRPIGAALINADGEVVASGRNRSQETVAPPGQLSGTAIAHAEINVLAQLSSRRRYEDHRLFTTLEPCLLCSGALIHAHVGTVVYAAPDPLWHGIEQVPSVGGTIAARWVRREGPDPGPLAVFGAMLMHLWTLRHTPQTGEQAGSGSLSALARQCLAIPGFAETESAETAYQLSLLRIVDAGL